MPETIRLVGDSSLRKVCTPLTFPLFFSIQGLLDLMFEAMKAEGGIGLAANQIGYDHRIFILKDGDSYKEYVNPEIVLQRDLVEFEGEGCLSIPGVLATTKRYSHLSLTWLDKNGIKNQAEFEGMQAFAVQHEVDHLNGKLYIDQFGPVRRNLVLGKHRKFIKRR
jgi:peptide deformylase